MNRVLVTGGAGSIGQELVKHYLKNSSIVCVFDNNEDGLFKLKSKLKQEFPQLQHRLRYFLGDIRDQKRLFNALKDVDIVFHCAALKHVAICEYNPTEAVATNIIGNVEKIIASKQADIDAAKQSYEELNQRLEQQVIQNANLSDLLSSQTSSIERLSNELEESQNVNRDLNIELNGMQIQMDRIKEENKTLKKAMSGQTKELEKYVDTLIDSIRKRFGYVPPQLKLTAFFGAPTFAHLSKEFWREP